MNQYVFLRRMRGPIMLLVFGVTAILDEYTGIHYSMSWPLYIIAWGVLKLAENAVLAQNPPPPPAAYPGYGPPGYAPPGYTPPGYAPPGVEYGAWQGGATPPVGPAATAVAPVEGEERNQP